jgi:hypothetical protein
MVHGAKLIMEYVLASIFDGAQLTADRLSEGGESLLNSNIPLAASGAFNRLSCGAQNKD